MIMNTSKTPRPARISVVPFVSDLRDEEQIRARISGYVEKLQQIKGFEFYLSSPDRERVLPSPDRAHPDSDMTLPLVLSGGTELQVLEFLACLDEPALILAHPSDNALAASLEILAIFNADAHIARLVQATPGWQEELRGLLKMFGARARMKRARLGVFGSREIETVPPWRLTKAVKQVWGPRLVRFDMDELIDAIGTVDPKEAKDVAFEFAQRARCIFEPEEDALEGSAKIYLALKKLVEQHRLDGITVKCFDLLQPCNNTGCYALARLSEEGIPAACEADILSCLGMFFIHELTSQPSFMANPSVIDVESGMIRFAHCTIPRTMTSAYRIRSHFESGIGTAVEGDVKPGPVTIVRIGGRRFSEVSVASGTVRECDLIEDMCRTQVTVELPDKAFAKQLLLKPFGNHHLIVEGDHRQRIQEFMELFIQVKP
jgi:L-fucose isomerase-like protein